jgi:hypothetical protein
MIRIVITLAVIAFTIPAKYSAQEPRSIHEIRNAIETSNKQAVKNWVKQECIGQYLTYVSFPRFSSKGQYAMIEVTSKYCDGMSLVLFRKGGNGHWIYIQTIRLSVHYDTVPDIHPVDFVQSGVTDLLIEHELLDWGTGVLQKNTSIYHMMNGQMKCIFNEPEYVHHAVEGPIIEQQSKFELHDSTPDSNTFGNKYLSEQQEIKIDAELVRRYRNCIWDDKPEHVVCVESSK